MSAYKPYPAYKDSGVPWLGKVPEGWEVKRLGQYFSERREKVSDKDYPPLSVTKNGVVPQLETAAKTDDGDNRKLVCAGDFVINSRSDRKGSAGISKLNGSVSLINTVIKPHAIISGSFINFLLRSHQFQEEFYRYGKGIVADLWSTNYSEMRNILLSVPTLSEQSAIAAFLDRETAKIDALIAAQRRLIDLLREKRSALISHAVTKGLNPDAPMKESGVPWLGEVPEGWEVSAIKRFATFIYGDALPVEARNVDGNVPVFGSNGSFGIHDQPNTMAPTILIGRKGSCGALNWSDVPVFAIDTVYFVDNRKCSENLCWFFWSLHTAKLETASQDTGVPGLSREFAHSTMLPVPPEQEQSAIAAFLDRETAKIDALISKTEQAIELAQERRSALISAAVTGKIDVRESPCA